MGRADLSMRLRINEYTHVRAIAQLNNGDLYMDSGFTRASGGCTQPPPFLQLKQARENIGKMKFRTFTNKEKDSGDTQLAQLMVSHPNVTGLQLDQRTRAYIPAEYMTKIEISYNDTHIMTAETGISISEDPSFRFFFKPGQKGTITAVMEDNKGRVITRKFEVN
jgi:sulfur-oxidizing protein SoxY